jgi:yeast amino acid transporter
VGGKPNAEAFFQWFLAAPFILALYVGWVLFTRRWVIGIRSVDMDLRSGLREDVLLSTETEKDRSKSKVLKTVLQSLA